MAFNSKDPLVLVHTSIWVLVVMVVMMMSSLSHATESDIYCLKTLKGSLEDPLNYLSYSWDFSNITEGFICKFVGVGCWHPDENRVLNLRLADLGLKGQFPRGVENCTSMTGLDLSGNNLSGSIPTDIAKRLKYVTSLDLSSNNFPGMIPVSLANCSYLNVLKLNNNQLMGNIPLELGLLTRLRTFNVANNLLSGQVPIFSSNTTATAESYANNTGLCGGPLPACVGAPNAM